MATRPKFCLRCGVPLDLGLAHCPKCGSKVGTVFSDESQAPVNSVSYKERVTQAVSAYQTIEKAHERANNSLILGLASFFCPGIGVVMGIASLVLGIKASNTLRAHDVEDGRGMASAGIVVGSIGLIAQICVFIYVIKQGLPLVGP